jgi:hypothetical protein
MEVLMKTIIMVASFTLVLTGCGDSNQFSDSSGKNPQWGQPGKTTNRSSESAEKEERYVDSFGDSDPSDGVGQTIPKSKGKDQQGKLGSIEKPISKENLSSFPQGSDSPNNVPSPNSENNTPSQKSMALVKDEINLSLSSMIAGKSSSLNKAQQNALQSGLVDISAGLLANPAGTGEALVQMIDLTKKVNSFKGDSNLALSNALPVGLPVDIPALADAAVIADFAAALGDLAAAAAAVDVAGIVAAIQDIIAMILDLIG